MRLRPAGSGGPEASRWLGLFLITRAAGVALVPPLLLLQDLPSWQYWMGGGGMAYGVASALVPLTWPRLQAARAFWAADCLALLALIVAYGEWRSPFYLLALSALILPTTTLPPRRAVAFGSGFVLVYLALAFVLGVDWDEIATSARMQSFGVLLAMPLIVTGALAFAADLLRRLERERERSERLALDAERQRIAWELHDSAKQRIHAAHLMLSAVSRGNGGSSPIDLAIEELRAATSDMDTSLRDLREPLFEDASLGAALRQWASRLQTGSDVEIEVVGDAPTLPAFTAAHAYRIGREALTNAVRHAGATRAKVVLEAGAERLRLVIRDDGTGLPEHIRPGAEGLRSMRNRANALGAELVIAHADDGRGTVVTLDAPLDDAAGGTA